MQGLDRKAHLRDDSEESIARAKQPQNPLDEVVGFVEELQDMVQVDDFIMMIHVDPYALDDSTFARLSRNMVPVSDRNNNDSR